MLKSMAIMILIGTVLGGPFREAASHAQQTAPDNSAATLQAYCRGMVQKIEPTSVGNARRLSVYLDFFRREMLGDPRLFPFEVAAKRESDGRVVLTGHVGYEENRTALLEFLRQLGFDRIDNQIEILPSPKLDDKPFGFIRTTHAFSYDRPAGKREVVTDLLLGTPVYLLRERRDGHVYCHAGEGYLGYVDDKDIRRVGSKEFARYQTGRQIRVQREFKTPDGFRVPMGARLRYVTLRGETVIGELPNGGEIAIPSGHCGIHSGEPGARIERVIANASQMLGVKYVWGGNTSDGIDCSGLVQTAFAAEGINLARDASQQMFAGRLTATRWNRDGLRPGDTLYFLGVSGKVTHTAIYVGEGRYLEAVRPRVRFTSFNPDDPAYDAKRARAFCFAKRLLD
jgi:hypothetical protein